MACDAVGKAAQTGQEQIVEQGEEDGEVESGEGEDMAGACFGEEGADFWL